MLKVHFYHLLMLSTIGIYQKYFFIQSWPKELLKTSEKCILVQLTQQ